MVKQVITLFLGAHRYLYPMRKFYYLWKNMAYIY